MSFGKVDYCFAAGETGVGIPLEFFDEAADPCDPDVPRDITGYSFNLRIRLPDGCVYNAPGAIVDAANGLADIPIDVTELVEGLSFGQLEVTDGSGNTTKYSCKEDLVSIQYTNGV